MTKNAAKDSLIGAMAQLYDGMWANNQRSGREVPNRYADGDVSM